MHYFHQLVLYVVISAFVERVGGACSLEGLHFLLSCIVGRTGSGPVLRD